MLLRRKILKLFGLSILFVSLPYQFLRSATKKIINPDLTKTQKDIMFNAVSYTHLTLPTSG